MNYKKISELTKKYVALTPWDYISDEKIFIVQHPQTHVNYYCSILGNSNIEFGLNAFVGTKGFLNVLSLFSDGPTMDLMERIEMLALNFDEAEFLSDEDLQIIEDHAIDYFDGLGYSQFSSKKSGFTFDSLNPEEIAVMEMILEQAIVIVKAFKKRPQKLLLSDFDQFKARIFKNDHWITTTITPEINLPTLEINPFVTRSLANRYSRKYRQWEIGFYYMDQLVNEPDKKPYFPGVIIIADTDEFQIIAHEVYTPYNNNLLVKVKDLMIQTIRKYAMLPSHVVFDDLEISVGLKSFVEALAIDYMYNPYPEVLDEIKMDIIEERFEQGIQEMKEEIKKQGLDTEETLNALNQQGELDKELSDLLKEILKDEMEEKF